MRLLIGAIFLLCSSAYAATGVSEPWIIHAYYGEAFVNPSDINSAASAQNTTPKLNSLTTATLYGGSLARMLSPKFALRVAFEMQDAKNGVNTTSPFVKSSAGFELIQDEIWGTLDYYLADTPHAYVYLGAGAGYPTYSHVVESFSSQTDYDAAKTVGVIGQLGAGVRLGTHLSLFVQADYQSLVSGNITTSSGTLLKNASGSNAVMNLSGLRALGGVGIHL